MLVAKPRTAYPWVGAVLGRRDEETDEAIDLHVRREDAERFLEDVRGDDEELADALRLEPVDLDAY